MNKQEQIFKEIKKGENLKVHILLEELPNINFQDRQGDTILMHAIIWGKLDIAKMILEKHGRSDLNLQNYSSSTALMLTIYNKNTELAKTLIKMGSDTKLKNKCGEDALDLAIKFNQKSIVEIIKEKRMREEYEKNRKSSIIKSFTPSNAVDFDVKIDDVIYIKDSIFKRFFKRLSIILLCHIGIFFVAYISFSMFNFFLVFFMTKFTLNIAIALSSIVFLFLYCVIAELVIIFINKKYKNVK